MENFTQILNQINNAFFFKTNLFNFLFVFLCLILILAKLNIGAGLEKTKNQIKNYVNEAENEKIEADTKLSEINNKISKLPDEIKNIDKTAKTSIERMAEKNKEDILEKKQDIDNSVNRIMDLETKKFKLKLASILSEASVNLARENAQKQLDNNRELHDKYIEEAIEEINGMTL